MINRERSNESRPAVASDESTRNTLRMVADTESWLLMLHTAKNMRPAQLGGIVERKMRHLVLPRIPIDFDSRYEQSIPEALDPNIEPIERNSHRIRTSLTDSEREWYRDRYEKSSNGKYTFLNRTIKFENEIDWNNEKIDKYPLLWKLKLQAFEHLEWLVLGHSPLTTGLDVQESLQRQILSWADLNPIGEAKYLRRSWIPHSVSLRIINWSRFAAWCDLSNGENVSDRIYEEIYKNALFLSNHVEYGVGGNHLIENAIALIAAGTVFIDHETDWIRSGIKILKRANKKQFMSDGGHFERSPMYHVMVLRRYITAYDLLSKTGRSVTDLERIIEQALGFLMAISKPDNRIPLLNDSVYHEQITVSTCLNYAAACGFEPDETSLAQPGNSGYRTLRSNAGTMLFDVGEVGPAHLPAHSHNDQLSILVWIDGMPLLTDTGVYDYARNQRRQFARSVQAHNTIQYGDSEPIPIGGRYLMGRRTSIETVSETNKKITAKYESKALTGPTYKCQRTVTTTSKGWRIEDLIDSKTEAPITVRYHFHPAISIKQCPNGKYEAYRNEQKLADLRFQNQRDQQLATSPYFPRYGLEIWRPMISVTGFTGTKISTEICSTKS